MGRRVPRDSGTSPRDAVKVTGWAIRCTILRNNPEQHLRRSLITFEDEAERTMLKLRNGKDSCGRVKFAFAKKERRQQNVLSNFQIHSIYSRLFYAARICLLLFLYSNYPSTSLSHGAKFRRVISFVAN